MLNLLPWIFFTLRGLGILVKPKKNETESHDYEVDNNCIGKTWNGNGKWSEKFNFTTWSSELMINISPLY